MSEQVYTQCTLRRDEAAGSYRSLTTFIDKKSAVVGAAVQVDGRDWTVQAVHQDRMEHEVARLRKK